MLLEQDQVWLNEVCKKIETKMAVISQKSAHKIPYSTVNGIHDDRASISGSLDDGISWWTNGFWAGMLWLMYHETKNESYKEIANISENRLDTAFEFYEGLHHDVGFMWLLSSVANYRLTGNLTSRKRGLHAANLLAGRYNPAGEFIRAWNDFDPNSNTKGWAIIDCMLNIPLLYWASDEIGDPRFKQIAIKHADTAMNAFVRPDGSVNHIVEFNYEEGGIVKSYGGQGYSEGSSWSRGQTWGIYGFVLSYIHTGKPEYLDTAKRIAHYFIANICDDYIPNVDFRAPKEPALKDATAGAIAACGLIEISRHVPEYEKDLYLNAAIKILKALDKKCCNWTLEEDSILQMCSASYHEETHHYPIIYGDYYFMEAIYKLKGNDILLW